MIITVPLTGELLTEDTGNDANPVRPLNFSKLLPPGLDDFAWEALSLDFEEGTATIEIRFQPKGLARTVEEVKTRMETPQEFTDRQLASENALRAVLKKPFDELYIMTGEPKLIKRWEQPIA